METIENRIRQIISQLTGIAADAPGDTDLYLELGVASVYAVQLLTRLEQEFGVAIPDDDFVEATTINKLTDMMAGLVNSSARS